MDVNIEDLREHYEQLPNEEIERLANYGACNLTPIAIEALKTELAKRNFSPIFREALDVNVRGLTIAEKTQIYNKISALPCPICGNNHSLLNARRVAEVVSDFIGIKSKTSTIIGCQKCIFSVAKYH